MITKVKVFRPLLIFCLVLSGVPLLGIQGTELLRRDTSLQQPSLTLQPSNPFYAPTAHDWSDPKTVFTLAEGTTAPVIPDLPSTDSPNFTNVALTLTYQYAQIGWGENPRLFWRKDSSEPWREIVVSQAYVYPIGFASKDGHVWLAAEVGLGNADLYFIDPETSVFTKQFAVSVARLSPDQKKVAFISSSGGCEDIHTISVWDLENNTKTTLTTLRESDPCSGRSFTSTWSTDSTLLRITGSAYGLSHFDYVYDHKKKALFEM